MQVHCSDAVLQTLMWVSLSYRETQQHILHYRWEYVLFHAHTTASVTEVFLLPALVCGTPCHHICGGTWTKDISSMHWKDICLGYSRPRRIVTNLLSCALEDYLLTYLLTLQTIFYKNNCQKFCNKITSCLWVISVSARVCFRSVILQKWSVSLSTFFLSNLVCWMTISYTVCQNLTTII